MAITTVSHRSPASVEHLGNRTGNNGSILTFVLYCTVVPCKGWSAVRGVRSAEVSCLQMTKIVERKRIKLLAEGTDAKGSKSGQSQCCSCSCSCSLQNPDSNPADLDSVSTPTSITGIYSHILYALTSSPPPPPSPPLYHATSPRVNRPRPTTRGQLQPHSPCGQRVETHKAPTCLVR